jgi:hypothetical protein
MDCLFPYLNNYFFFKFTVVIQIFSWIVNAKDIPNIMQVCRSWRDHAEERSLWTSVSSLVSIDGAISWFNFRNLGIKNRGILRLLLCLILFFFQITNVNVYNLRNRGNML